MEAVSSSSPTAADLDTLNDLAKQIRRHEVAMAELTTLSSSRTVYEKKGNIFFRTTVPKATASEQRQLDVAKAKLQKLSSP